MPGWVQETGQRGLIDPEQFAVFGVVQRITGDIHVMERRLVCGAGESGLAPAWGLPGIGHGVTRTLTTVWAPSSVTPVIWYLVPAFKMISHCPGWPDRPST